MRKPLPYILACIILLVSLASQAQMSWRWGRIGSSLSESYPVAADKWGNVYASGINATSRAAVFDSLSVPSTGYQSVWVKYGPNGLPLWADGTRMGNTNVYNITTDTAGNLIIFGNFVSDSMKIGTFVLHNRFPDVGNYQYFVAKIDPSGTATWAITDGRPSFDFSDGFYAGMLKMGDVTTDDQCNIYITSSFKMASMTIGSNTLTNATPAYSDVFVAKYSPSGTLLWAKSFGGNANDFAFGITATSGGVYVTGAFRSSAIGVGTSVITNSFARPSAYIAQLNPSTGMPMWAQAAGNSRGAYSVGIKHDEAGNIYMDGSFADTSITFGATTLTRQFPEIVPGFATFLVKYSPSNTLAWGRIISSGVSAATCYSLGISEACGKVWVGGTCSGSAVGGFSGTGDTLHIASSPADLPFYLMGYDLSGTVCGYTSQDVGGDDECDVACDAVGNVFMGGDFEGTLVAGHDEFVGTTDPLEHFCVAKYGYVPDTFGIHQDAFICVSGSTTIIAPSGYNSYLWDDGELTTSRTISAPGNYVVYMGGCGDSTIADTFNVTIGPDSLFTRIDTAICVYSDLVIEVPLSPAYGTSYTWFDGTTGNIDSVTRSGDYWVAFRNGCMFEFDTFHVVFNLPPPRISGPSVLCVSDSALYLDDSLGGTWGSSAVDTAVINGLTGVAIGIGAGSVNITYTAPSGCYTTKSIVVDPLLACGDRVSTQQLNDKVVIAPNPVADLLSIDVGASVYSTIEIFNSLGQVVLSQSLAGTHTTVLSTRTLTQGAYYIRFSGASGAYTTRFVKM